MELEPFELEKSPSGDASPSRRRHTYTPEFEAWYSLYPLKTGKLGASRAYAKAAQRVGHQVLLDAVERFRNADKAKGEYCWHPATFLNGGHYEDDPAAWRDRNGQPTHDDNLNDLSIEELP